MGHPKKPNKAIIDPKFSARIDALEQKARNFADHFRHHNTYREWHVPADFVDPLDVPALHVPAWDRNVAAVQPDLRLLPVKSGELLTKILEAIKSAVHDFSGHRPLEDDQTGLVVKRA